MKSLNNIVWNEGLENENDNIILEINPHNSISINCGGSGDGSGGIFFPPVSPMGYPCRVGL